MHDKKQFEQIFKKYYRQLCRFAFTFLKDKDDAEEIVQHFFVNLWNNSQNINITTSLEAFLYMSVKNCCLNKLKHIKIREAYKEENFENIKKSYEKTAERVEIQDLEAHISAAIEQLPDKRREIFKLSRYNGLTYNEIAEKMNISPKTVENQITAALKFLRDKLKNFLIFLIFLTTTIGALTLLIVLNKN